MTDKEALKIVDECIEEGKIVQEAFDLSFFYTVKEALGKQIPKNVYGAERQRDLTLLGYARAVGIMLTLNFAVNAVRRLTGRRWKMKLKTTIEFFEDTQAHIREMEFSDANEAFILNSLSEGYFAEAINALKKEKEYKKRITELVELIEISAQEIREKYVDTDFCGLCEYDADFSIGESGCSMNECPGFDRNDCFRLKKSFREKYIDWSEVEDENDRN